MASLTLRLFGAPEVCLDGRTLELGVKPTALLALLALAGSEQPFSRDRLAAWLWFDKPNPLGNLNSALNKMRDALAAEVFASDERQRTIWLGIEIECDVLMARSALGSDDPGLWARAWLGWSQSALTFPDPRWDTRLDPEFQEWLLELRESLHLERRELASRLALAALERQAWAQAVPYLESCVPEVGDPREQLAFYAMLVHTALGSPDHSGRIYQRLLDALSEFGGKPSPDAELAHEIERSWSVAAARGLLEEYFPADREAREVPFVGREDELEAVVASIPSSLEGRAFAVVLTGEPGAGKTAFARHLIKRLDPKRRAYLTAEGFSERLAPAWRSFDLVVRQLVRSRRSDLETMPLELRITLAHFVPDLLETTGEEPLTKDERLLFSAIRWLLTHAERPTLLLLDDVQWIDERSLGFLLELLRKPPPRGLLLIATQRDTEQPTSADLERLPELLRREHSGISLELPPLDTSAIQELARRLGQPDTDLAWLQQQSGGNALYLLEMLEADYVKPNTGAIPPNVRELIQYRLNTINQNSDARHVLEACAVLGEGSTLLEIKTVTELGYEAVIEGLSLLRTTRVLRRGDTSIHFNHDLTLGVAKAHLTPERQQLLHLRAAKARHDKPELAARHYWSALNDGAITLDAAQMADISETFAKAGTSQSLRGDMTAGTLWYDRALERATTPNTRVRTLTRRARVFERLMRLDEATQDLDRADLLVAGLDQITRASLLNARATLLGTYYRDANATADLARKALALLEGQDSIEVLVERGNALHNLGLAKWLEQDLQNAEKHHREALEIRRALKDLERIGDSLSNLGIVLSAQLDRTARPIFEESLEIWNRLGNLANVARTCANLGLLAWRLGDFSLAESNFKQALHIVQPLGTDILAHAVHNNLGIVRFEQGKYCEAREAYLVALNSSRVAQSKPSLALFRGNLVEVEVRLGLLEQAQMNLDEAFELLRDTANDALLAKLYLLQGDIFALLKNFSSAAQAYRFAIDPARNGHRTDREAMALSKLARLETNADLAKKAVVLSDSPMTRASLYMVNQEYERAQSAIVEMEDIFEEARLLLDIAHLTNEKRWQIKAENILEQLRNA